VARWDVNERWTVGAEPTVGVVIAVRDGERWLGQALHSALAQEHPPIDIVVVDDGSADASGAVAERYGPPVRVVRQANAGIGAARNRGIATVEGELLAFLDADDLLTPSSLAVRVEVLVKRPEIDMVFGAVRRFSEILDGTPVALNEPQAGHMPTAMLARRSAVERVGPFLTATHVAEGLDWMLRAREQRLGEVTLADHILWRRLHGENNSLRHRAEIGEFAHALKASLDRRRAADRVNSQEAR
jgi:glycosyltransferase involved in cell wall biosynthesis